MKYVLWAGLTLLIVYEIWATLAKSSGDTISELIWAASRNPLIPFIFGMFAGHLFWPRSK